MGERYSDEQGTALPDLRAARKAALEVVAELIRDAADELWRGDGFRVVAEDDRCVPLFMLDVTARAAQ
jgi:hypothetical protein